MKTIATTFLLAVAILAFIVLISVLVNGCRMMDGQGGCTTPDGFPAGNCQ